MSLGSAAAAGPIFGKDVHVLSAEEHSHGDQEDDAEHASPQLHLLDPGWGERCPVQKHRAGSGLGGGERRKGEVEPSYTAASLD